MRSPEDMRLQLLAQMMQNPPKNRYSTTRQPRSLKASSLFNASSRARISRL